MEHNNYISPLIANYLKTKFVDERILQNPRAREIENIMVEQAKKVGTVFMYKELDIYEQKITEMLTYLMNSGDFLKVDKDGSVVINFPEKINVEKDCHEKEKITFKYASEKRILKERIKKEKQGNKIKEEIQHSEYDENGIEISQEENYIIDNILTQRIQRIRSLEKPHIIKENNVLLGETKYYDLRNEEYFEEIEKGEEIQEATEMTNVEKIRLAERTRYSIYGAGIEKILGLQEKMSNQEKENDEK